jgi:hypothetical protein
MTPAVLMTATIKHAIANRPANESQVDRVKRAECKSVARDLTGRVSRRCEREDDRAVLGPAPRERKRPQANAEARPPLTVGAGRGGEAPIGRVVEVIPVLGARETVEKIRVHH